MVERRLAAILAADVAGYSRLMGADEEGVLAALRALREELFDPAIARHRGRIVKLMGDGALVEFASVVDAVKCGAEVQRALAERNAGQAEDKRLELRIGINLGDVMIDGDNLYGDGVNIAARLEALAVPGGICVSQAVIDQARGKVDLGFEDQGEKSLKNIAAPVRVYRVLIDGAPAPAPPPARRRLAFGATAVVFLAALAAGGWYLTRPAPVAAISADRVMTIKGPAIAALPFANLSGDAAHDLFARGITDQVSAALTRFKGVRVLSPRASSKYADDLVALKRELGADYLLEGNVRRSAERIRITAILSKLPNGAQVWTDSFEVEVTPANIVEVQDRLAGRIAGALADDTRGVVTLDRVASQAIAAPNDQSSLDCLVTGSTWRTEEGIRATYKCLAAALERDPSYSAGWIRLLYICEDAYIEGWAPTDDPEYDPLAVMMNAARMAVKAAPNSAEARAALAFANYYNGDDQQFLAEMAKFLELNPNDAGTIGWLGTLLAFSGHWDEGGALARKALDFNPSVVTPAAWYALAKGHYVRGEYPEALEDFQHVWAAYDGYWINDLNRAYLYADWGKQAEAEKAAAALMEQRPDFVVEDAAEFYRRLRFQESYIDKMVKALKKAGLPSRGES